MYRHQKPPRKCPHCTGTDGRPKNLYATKDDAVDSAAYIWRTRGVDLRWYPCDWLPGWHLTSDA